MLNKFSLFTMLKLNKFQFKMKQPNQNKNKIESFSFFYPNYEILLAPNNVFPDVILLNVVNTKIVHEKLLIALGSS